ncbi:tetratricopeptide repeat protein [uncultured Chryseobacterium sp.]|uniref:tetratricopeptide repeat protein n=1 Tax=uncultured Chryseobacterium sp. TaxID=259322 RepID=UPI0025FC0361|nr:tetratricopeptide repeat protein [uncultured Chryseobacterium sp.]
MKKIVLIIVGIIAIGLIVVIAKNSIFTDSDTQFYEDGWEAHGKKQYELAIFYFERINKDKYPDAFMGLGSSYLELNDYENAILNFEKAVRNKDKYSPEDNGKIQNSLGYCYLQIKNFNKAKQHLLEADQLGNPNSKRNLQILDSLETASINR